MTSCLAFCAIIALSSSVCAEPSWKVNHTSQVKSIAVIPDSWTILTGSQFTDDQSVSSLSAETGKLFWSSEELAQWTYGVAVQGSANPGVAAFGCPFDTERTPVPPCVIGFWKNATDKQLSWKLPLAGAELSAGAGPPFVAFSSDDKSIVVTFVDRNSTDHSGAEFMAVISTSDPTQKPTRAVLGSGQGHGLHVARGSLQSSWALISRPPPAPPTPAPGPPWVPASDCKPPCGTGESCCKNPATGQTWGICFGVTNCNQLLHKMPDAFRFTEPIRYTQYSSAVEHRPLASRAAALTHFAVQWGPETITIANVSSIDCNETAYCTWLDASADLAIVLVDAAATGPGSACALQPMDPFRWGIASLHRSGSSWPPVYATKWTQCSTSSNTKALTSVRLTADGSRVMATFVHVTKGTTNVVAAEACAFRAADGAQLWCTQPYPTPGGSITPTVAAVSSSGQLVWHHATAGLLMVDAMAAGTPQIQLLYSGGASDCCSATALAISKDVVVASIPDGTLDPPWCRCQHSKLLGVKL